MVKGAQTVSVTMPTDTRFIASLRVFAYEFMKQAGASEKDARRTEFIVGELCANAIEYGKDATTVKICLTLESDNTIRIECTNVAKNASVTSKDLTEKLHQDADTVSKRGRGLYVIRQWARDIAVEDIDGGLKISVVQSF